MLSRQGKKRVRFSIVNQIKKIDPVLLDLGEPQECCFSGIRTSEDPANKSTTTWTCTDKSVVIPSPRFASMIPNPDKSIRGTRHLSEIPEFKEPCAGRSTSNPTNYWDKIRDQHEERQRRRRRAIRSVLIAQEVAHDHNALATMKNDPTMNVERFIAFFAAKESKYAKALAASIGQEMELWVVQNNASVE